MPWPLTSPRFRGHVATQKDVGTTRAACATQRRKATCWKWKQTRLKKDECELAMVPKLQCESLKILETAFLAWHRGTLFDSPSRSSTRSRSLPHPCPKTPHHPTPCLLVLGPSLENAFLEITSIHRDLSSASDHQEGWRLCRLCDSLAILSWMELRFSEAPAEQRRFPSLSFRSPYSRVI